MPPFGETNRGQECLIDKSLIAMSDHGDLRMHNLIKQMGREIVRKEAPLNPGKRSRLWNHKDVLKILHEIKSTHLFSTLFTNSYK